MDICTLSIAPPLPRVSLLLLALLSVEALEDLRTSESQMGIWVGNSGTLGVHNSASGWRGPVRKAGVYSQQSQEAGLVLMVSALASDGDRVHEGGR